MARKIMYFTPDQMGYKDRGKMKWLGMMLSDHSEALYKMADAEKKQLNQRKLKQTDHEKNKRLTEAYSLKKPVSLQINSIQNGTYADDIHCMISGNFDNKIILSLKDGRVVSTTFENIHYIEFLASDIWYQKNN